METAHDLDNELAQQIKTIKVVTAEWKEMKVQVSMAAETLEQFRVRCVQAEQDNTDHFQFGNARYLAVKGGVSEEHHVNHGWPE